MFLGIILGAFIYMLFISSYIIKINIKIINLLCRLINIITIPFKFIFNIFRRTFIKPVTFLFINVRKIFTNFIEKIQNLIKKPKKNINVVKN